MQSTAEITKKYLTQNKRQTILKIHASMRDENEIQILPQWRNGGQFCRNMQH